jgi:ferredoxin-NADP reductase/Na+-translocating ferredoxin:NAD+ oxidoreductase RnfD subunit
MDSIDLFLNRITPYRLTLIGLSSLAVLAFVFAFLGWLPFTGFELLFSLLLLVLATRAANAVGALFTKTTSTPESAYITALILFFILAPLQSAHDGLFLMLAAVVAILSKYVFVLNKRHIFNPAAFGVFIFSIFSASSIDWWIATPIMLPFVIFLGFLLIRKLHRADLFVSFAISAIVVLLVRSLIAGTDIWTASLQMLITGPFIFFGTVMLTEPQTTPPTKNKRLVYGGSTGFLYSLSFQLGPLAMTPELALLVANLYAFFVSNYRRFTLRFQSITRLAHDTYELAFIPDTAIAFEAGQHMEWTSSHRKADKRGIRRHFAIVSAPSDPFIRLGLYIPTGSSTFKTTLKTLEKDAVFTASNVSGDLVLPADHNQKLAFIADGIGIAPFMSMFRHLAAQNARRDMVLIYAAATPLDFAYQEEIDAVKDSIGLQVGYLPVDFGELTGWQGPTGYLTNVRVKKDIPDFASRQWYVAGPSVMVKSYKRLLKITGVPASAIKTEYFDGF